MNIKQLLLTSIQASIEAGEAILEVYESDFAVEQKDDKSPLTLADKRSHDIIVKHLKRFDIPILSEEGRAIPYPRRKAWDTLWVVDPLDGTKEFVKRNGEFTVNIALVKEGQPILGVIFIPVKNTLFFAAEGVGSYRAALDQLINLLDCRLEAADESQSAEIVDGLAARATKLPDAAAAQRPYTIVGSRSHSTPELEAFVAQKRREHADLEYISSGSSLKICLVAEGKADIYPRLAPTMEWDTAAGQAIAECAGAKVLQHDTDKSLSYNRENLLNPWFIVSRD